MSEMTLFGWTHEQFGYARSRHKDHGYTEPERSAKGLVEVRAWWDKHRWPDPLSVRFDGVDYKSGDDWAADAWRAALASLLTAAPAMTIVRLARQASIERGHR